MRCPTRESKVLDLLQYARKKGAAGECAKATSAVTDAVKKINAGVAKGCRLNAVSAEVGTTLAAISSCKRTLMGARRRRGKGSLAGARRRRRR